MSGPVIGAADLTGKIRTACFLEAAARKAGNVHPGAAFEHVCYEDFIRSAEACAPVIAQAGRHGVGPTVRDAVLATRECCRHNTNLGIILLLTPLAAVPDGVPLADGIGQVLKQLTEDDTAAVYEAIRIAAPRGLGESPEADVGTSSPPLRGLTEVMKLAADRDSVAAQYATEFRTVLWFGVPRLEVCADFPASWEEAVVRLQLELMARRPDTDIARKCGKLDAAESARRAKAVLAAGWPVSVDGRSRFREFDRWLRARKSLRNPGTTADLVTACLFAALRGNLIEPPDPAAIADHVRLIRESIAPNPGTARN